MNIFRYEFKGYIRSIVLWSVGIFAIMIMFMAFYPSFGKDAALMDKMLESYPEELLAAFGMNGGLSLSTVLGFLVFAFVFVQLCLAIQSSIYGFSFLSVEERELTADFLMTKPVSRKTIIISKFIAVLTSLIITNVITWVATFVSIELFKDGMEYDSGKVVLLLASIIIFQMFFLSIGMIVSLLVKKVRNVLSYSMALAFGLYILNALRGIIGGELLGIFTPYYHFDPSYILDKGKYDLGLASISLGVIIVSIVASYSLYQRRDIHSL